jgi:hypothetical protein
MDLAAFALGVKLHADVRGQPPVRALSAAKRPSVITFVTEKVILGPAGIEFDITTRSERRCGYRRASALTGMSAAEAACTTPRLSEPSKTH